MRALNTFREGLIIVSVASIIIASGLWNHRYRVVKNDCGSEIVSCSASLDADLSDRIVSELARGWPWRTHNLTSVIKTFETGAEVPTRVCHVLNFISKEFNAYPDHIKSDRPYSVVKLKRNVKARETLLNSKFSGVPLKRESSLRAIEIPSQCEETRNEIEFDLFLLPLCNECKNFFLHEFSPLVDELTQRCHALKVRVVPFVHLNHPRLDERSKFEFKMMRAWFNRHGQMTLDNIKAWYSIGSRDYKQKSALMDSISGDDEVSLDTIRSEFRRITGNWSAPILFVNQTYWPLDKYSFNLDHLSDLLSIDYGCEQ